MKRNIQLLKNILYRYMPSILIVFLAIIQGISTGYLNSFLFVLTYNVVLYNIFMNEKRISVVAVFFTGLVLDSVNDIALGLSSFLLLATYVAVKYEMKYVKIKDFLSAYLFFALNTLSIIIFVKILSFIKVTNFIDPIYFIVVSLLLFPFIFNIVKIYSVIYPKNYDQQ